MFSIVTCWGFTAGKQKLKVRRRVVLCSKASRCGYSMRGGMYAFCAGVHRSVAVTYMENTKERRERIE